MKRIIRTIPIEMHLAQGAVIYDGLEDFITEDDFDHTTPDVLYASMDTPVYEQARDEKGEYTDGEVKVSNETVLKAPDPSIKARQTFAGWDVVGTKVVEKALDVPMG